ncbi:MAG: beta-galactosidase [Candidatus Moraniibacteriota bacterium]
MQKIKKIAKLVFKFFLTLFSLATVLIIFFNIPVWNENTEAKLGVTFSMRYATDIGLNWREAYLATMDDLGIKKIRIPVYWDFVSPKEGEYDFADLDWQLSEAEKRQAEIILVVGQKVPRWPECFIPEHLKADDAKRKTELLKFISIVVERYKNNSAVKYWQVENEPFLKFGECPELDVSLLDQEIALVRATDPTHKVIITDSGELSLWTRAEKRADIFGTTMYRTIYSSKYGFYTYPIGPRFFQFKYWMNRFLVGQKNAIVIELQAEPWIAGWTTNQPLEKQFESMNANRLQENVSFARQVGFPEIYLWGVEWWYWLKTTQNHPELWDTAKIMFNND